MFTARMLPAALTAMTAMTALPALHAQAPAPAYLYVWARSADSTRPRSFLLTLDLRAGSPTAGQVVRCCRPDQGRARITRSTSSRRTGCCLPMISTKAGPT